MQIYHIYYSHSSHKSLIQKKKNFYVKSLKVRIYYLPYKGLNRLFNSLLSSAIRVYFRSCSFVKGSWYQL